MSGFQLGLETREDINEAIKTAWVAGAVAAGLTAAVALYSLFSGTTIAGIGGLALVDVALLAGLAYSVYRRSRVGAVSLLVWHVFNQVMMRVDGAIGGSTGVVMALIFAGFYVQGVRGTFKYHRLSDEDPGDVSEEESEGNPRNSTQPVK